MIQSAREVKRVSQMKDALARELQECRDALRDKVESTFWDWLLSLDDLPLQTGSVDRLSQEVTELRERQKIFLESISNLQQVWHASCCP